MTIRGLVAVAFVTFAHAAEPVQLDWLGGVAPGTPAGISWGVPWPKGAVPPASAMHLTAADGTRVDVQTWPLAYWPDGSVKWTGHAAVTSLAGPFTLAPGSADAERAGGAEIRYAEDVATFTIDTGAVRAVIGKHDRAIISLRVGDRVVAENGELIALREERSDPASPRTTELHGRVEHATLEQSGPVRAVVKLEGRHTGPDGRQQFPFTVRLAFFAGSGEIKLTHSFIYDGDPAKDFIRGLGLSFRVPFREELHNRHFRFVGDAAGGVWTQPVRMLPGYRAQAGQTIANLYAQNLAGERVPNLADFEARTRDAILTVPVWSDAKLTQLGPNNWSLFKRTATTGASWLHVNDGHRARGLAVFADVSGGLAVGVKDFWQKAPKSFELTGGASDAGTLKIWLWSPEAGAMDLRRYDEVPHGLGTNYEDWKPGWGTALGVANTHDLTLWALGAIPPNEQILAMARAADAPPILVCSPEYYHAQHATGRWALPDRSTPAAAWIETQVETFVNYYRDQVDERSWYGFWDFGDIMHNYDFGRHEWRYDVGGWAWANTELMPDLLLWYSFLRTGRADLFRMAEAMTRHTSEVDVYHAGPFAPLGSRHNVNHWGDGAKQPRISHAGLKRAYYFLSGGDGRVGDLLHEQVDADLTYSYLARFNNAHYVPNADGMPRLQNPNSAVAPRPENFEARPTAASRQPFTRFGLEWMCYAMNWTTEWERGLDPTWRAKLEADMKAMAASVDAQGRFPGRYFDMIFGGPENMWEMEPMYDLPDFWAAWANTSEAVGRQVNGGQMTGPRMLAYAAQKKHDPALGRLAWEKLIGPPGHLPPLNHPTKVQSPGTLRAVTDPSFLGEPVGWQLHGVASVQWCLNAIETLEFAREWLPLWENSEPGNPTTNRTRTRP